ncbi:Hpt domain-containing protein [Aliivibrio sp. S3MY1]|uniref:Hpt domain-containing protein n=1 Tax=unclassified Aliivibrio TaxID=2645654 RepID=UPI002379DE3D|nr:MULTISPECIES: Hpt domain-containing protein [unclassified Aliivibrio]MDD9194425.1 Hpt domain-containing protein [Aliivibrio sp. S3MY1]MDD9198236.1 Hpt domain-containing protein [Aliivibrio sp. S2MY1]
MININMLEEMFEGDHEIIQQLFTLYLSENESITQDIRLAYENDNLNELYNTAHSLSGALGNLCDTNVTCHIKEIEYLTKNDTTPNIDTINIAIKGLNDIAEQMKAYLA